MTNGDIDTRSGESGMKNMGRHSFDFKTNIEDDIEDIEDLEELLSQESEQHKIPIPFEFKGTTSSKEGKQGFDKFRAWRNLKQLRLEFESQKETHSAELESIDRRISSLNERNKKLSDNQEKLRESIAQNEKEIEKMQTELSDTIENQESISKSLIELRNQLKENLFKPIATGLSVLSLIATIVLLLSRSYVAIPTFLLSLLFITAAVTISDKYDSSV